MRKHLKKFQPVAAFAATLAVSLAISSAASASATVVTGTLNFPAFFGNGFSGINYYNPRNGFVPAGDGNSKKSGSPKDTTAGEPVTVGSGTEFGYADGITTMTADFTDNSLTLQDVVDVDLAKNQQIFTASTPGFFDNLKLVSNTYPSAQGGLTYSLSGDTLTVLFAGANANDFPTLPYTADAKFTFGPVSPAPEPSTWALLMAGVGLTGFALRSRRKPALAAI